jgi:hypothetical protein
VPKGGSRQAAIGIRVSARRVRPDQASEAIREIHPSPGETNRDFGLRFFLGQGRRTGRRGAHDLCNVGFLRYGERPLLGPLSSWRPRGTRAGSAPATIRHWRASRARLIDRAGSDEQPSLPPRFTKSQIGCVAGPRPPNQEFIGLWCPGDQGRLGRHVESVKAGARARAGAVNYLGAMGKERTRTTVTARKAWRILAGRRSAPVHQSRHTG